LKDSSSSSNMAPTQCWVISCRDRPSQWYDKQYVSWSLVGYTAWPLMDGPLLHRGGAPSAAPPSPSSLYRMWQPPISVGLPTSYSMWPLHFKVLSTLLVAIFCGRLLKQIIVLRDYRTDLANNWLPGGRAVCRISTSCSAASDAISQCSRSHAGTASLGPTNRLAWTSSHAWSRSAALQAANLCLFNPINKAKIWKYFPNFI